MHSQVPVVPEYRPGVELKGSVRRIADRLARDQARERIGTTFQCPVAYSFISFDALLYYGQAISFRTLAFNVIGYELVELARIIHEDLPFNGNTAKQVA